MQHFDGFDDFVIEIMADWQVPGLAVAVVQDDEVIYQKGYGFRDVESQSPVDVNTVFAIGSSSKAFTATAVGILVDEGLLDWNTPIRHYMPDFQLKDPFATERMTAIDLICHRSGLPRHDLMWYGSPHDRKALFKRLKYLEPSKDFRTFLQYQNLMYMTAGYLIEAITGKTWEAFIEERIFTPLGMTESNCSVVDTQKGDNFALPYASAEGEERRQIPFRNIDNVGPAGSINSNVVDMVAWLRLNLNKGKLGEEQLVSEAVMQEIHSSQMPIIPSAVMFPMLDTHPEVGQSSYGMGWFIQNYRGNRWVHHGGSIDGFIAFVGMLPQRNIGVVCLSNLGGKHVPMIVTTHVFDRLLEDEPIDWNTAFHEFTDTTLAEIETQKQQLLESKHPDTRLSHTLDAYAGEYTHPAYGTLEITVQDDTIHCHYNTLELIGEHLHYDIFLMKIDISPMPIPANFITGISGDIEKLEIQLEPAVAPIIFLKAKREENGDE